MNDMDNILKITVEQGDVKSSIEILRICHQSAVPEELTFTSVSDLNAAAVIREHDLIRIWHGDEVSALDNIFANCLSPVTCEQIEHGFALKVRELWELTTDQTLPFEIFLEHKQDNREYAVVVDRLTGDIWKTLMPEDFRTVMFSRTFPLLSQQTIENAHQSTVFFSGLSTGSPVVLDAVGLGVGSIIGTDPDEINLSNIRMRISDAEVGIKKAVWLAHRIVRVNPYLKIKMFPRVLSQSELEDCIQEAAVVCEMTDYFANKITVREVARALNTPVLMGSGFGSTPSFTVEEPTDSLFLGKADAATLETLVSPEADPRDKARKAIQIVGIENLSTRALLNFILVAQLGYWAQLQTTASVVGGVTALQILFRINDHQLKSATALSLLDEVMDRENIHLSDQQLLHELQMHPRFQKLFAGYSTLTQAVQELLKQTLDIDWQPS